MKRKMSSFVVSVSILISWCAFLKITLMNFIKVILLYGDFILLSLLKHLFIDLKTGFFYNINRIHEKGGL